MSDGNAFAEGPSSLETTRGGVSKGLLGRLRHLLYAGAVALAMLAAFFLQPLDQFSWVFQSRLANHSPSGEMVFVGVPRDTIDPALDHRREALAETLRELDRQGAGKIYIDVVFDEASTPEADKALSDAIAALGPRVALVDHIERSATSGDRIERTMDAIGGRAERVASRRTANWLGFVWTKQYGYTVDGKRQASLAAALAGIDDARPGEFQIDYTIPAEDFTSIEVGSIENGEEIPNVAGRTVVIGQEESVSDAQVKVPGNYGVPPSYVAIYAAESLRSGRTGFLDGLRALTIYTFLFAALIIAVRTRKRRQIGYFAIVASIPVLLYVGSYIGVRMELSYCIALLVVYGLFRSRAQLKDRVAMVDTETGLPRLRALEVSALKNNLTHGHIVVARIHGYEHVLRTLARDHRSQYILKLVDRLRASDSDLAIFYEGHHLAWHSKEDDTQVLSEHLEGLRAIFAAPVNVAGSSVDVGISFGVARLDGDPATRLAAAVAAAEESSEALQPIKVAETGSRFDQLWDISLRARIDEAMEAGEIYCVYQPKVDTARGAMVGVEALVRWHDPARGFIPPMHFIAQCEKAGRMEHLTRYVLQSACSAGRLMHFRGRNVTMSVNMSATLLGDLRIVGIVRNALQASGFDPRFLILEVTETSRIGDLATAATILEELKSLGVRISIDDFGCGAANFETFFELPFDELKIDRLFVSNLTTDAKAKAIASSIVSMGKEARIMVTAEGAEDEETLRILNEIGCNYVQGYVLSRPISLTNLLKFQVSDGDSALEA
ncbi:EAL domain-containing protein [Qipengyuania aquimaris]|uniref:GGDEF domain-containing phosphodiesterase n=1 Tax=Qipengyuania aquimaris TaxID=255984 RepID=UPI001C9501DB|nr:EAL domain-containing protein [Qipengyuania aquimaris]MBY6129503.1 EAL domain-containing protein [Qipengyuania aquimaris]